VAPRGPADVPELVAVLPEAKLAVSVQLWVPDAVDLGPPKPRDRVRFEKAGDGAPGQVLFVRLPAAPRPQAPDLVQLRGAASEGRYEIVALGQGSSSGPAVLKLMEKLEQEGRAPQALELSAGFSRLLPGSSARTDVLLASGKLAERLAASGRLDLLQATDRAAQLLGEPIFAAGTGQARYAGAFEALVEGQGRFAEEASFRLITRASPCGAGEVERRAAFFLQRFPASAFAPEARLWLARAQEDEYWRGGGPKALSRAIDSYRAVAQAKREGAAEARQRLKRLNAKKPQRPATPQVVCQ
jgi:hypothetical protein